MRIALLSCLLLAACSVGEVGGTSIDAGGNGCVDRLTPAGGAHMHIAGGTSNKGQNCIVAACHLANNPGAGAPGFQFAGTVYAGATTNPQAGAQVRIKGGPMPLTTYTDTDGNFYFMAGSLPGQFTANTDVSACPTIMNMSTQLIGGGGAGANSCNLCHAPTAAGGTTAPISL